MRNSFLIIILIISAFLTYAQDPVMNYESPKIPPSPDAASLGRYGEYPVQLSSGLPNINIPLFDIKSMDINLPISLSYHAAGIKVSQESSWVGLGWTLNAGGMISRTINGKNDFGPYGYENYMDQIDDLDFTVPFGETNHISIEVADGRADMEPDSYFYNASNLSGKFFYVNDNAYIIPNDKDIKIEYINNVGSEYNSWKLTANDGTIYLFGGTSEYCGRVQFSSTCISDAIPTEDDYIGEYYLSKIISPNGNEIVFSYDKTMVLSQTIIHSASKKHHKNYSISADDEECSSNTSYISNRLSRIDFNSGYLLFNSDHQRLDQNSTNSNAISCIELYDLNNELKKKYEFSYSYFGNTSDPVKCRLKLNGISQVSTDNTESLNHTFSYLENPALPPKDSHAQDHWGYYNGELNYQSLVPRTYGGNFDNGGIRDPDESFMKAGMLSEIVYPTGGRSVFSFEPHDFPRQIDEEVEYSVTTTCTHNVPNSTNVHSDSKPFTLNYTQAVKVVTFATQPTLQGNKLLSKIYAVDDPTNEIWSTHKSGTEYEVLDPGDYILESKLGIEHSEYMKITSTLDYKEKTGVVLDINEIVGGLRIQSIESSGEVPEGSLSKEYIYRIGIDSDQSSGCITFDHDFEEWLASYSYPTTISIPEYSSNPQSPCESNNYQGEERKSNNPAILGSSSDYVSYAKVWVKHGENGEGGYEQFIYEMHTDIGGNTNSPPTSYSWRRGKEKYHAIYDNQLNTINVKETFYTIENTLFNKEIEGARVSYRKRDGCQQVEEHMFYVNKYKLISEWIRISNVIETNYFNNGSELKSETIFEYDIDGNHHSPVSVKNALSDGSLLETKHKYPQQFNTDVTSGFAAEAIKEMKEKHMFNPVEVLKYKDNVCISGDLVLFQLETCSTNVLVDNMVLPKEVLKLKLYNGTNVSFSTINTAGKFIFNSNYKTKTIFDEYDDYGNLLQFHNDEGVPISFIWGYNNEYMIARGENVEFNNFTFDPVTGTRSCPSDAFMETFTYKPLVGLKTKGDKNELITTYLYDNYNRLETVLNHNNKVIKHIDYHYINQ